MGKFNHNSDSLGESVGFGNEKQRGMLQAFNDALDNIPEENGSKSQILEQTMKLARQRGLLQDEHDHFFGAFFLADLINKKQNDDGIVDKTLKSIASTFAKQLRDRGIDLDDLPLEEMIDEVKGEVVADDIDKILKLDVENIINKEKLLQHMESDENDF